MGPCAGSYNDGRSAARREVTVELGSEALCIRDRDGIELERWPYEELHLLDEVSAKRPVRLKRGRDGVARLRVSEPEILAALMLRAPNLVRRSRARPGILRVLGLGALGMAIFVAVVWLALPGLATWTARQIPVSWERALGDRAMEQTREVLAMLAEDELTFCARPAGRAALERLTGRLAAATRTPYDFRVAVLDHELVNAVALPGGRIVLFRGLIEGARGPDEVAGVLAHEMGHVALRHGTEALLRKLGLQVLFGLLLGDLGEGVFGSLGEVLLGVSYTRDAEAAADRAALEILARAEVRADGLAAFFERLAAQGRELPDSLAVLSTHPPHAARAKLFAAAAGRGGPAMEPEAWQALQDVCGGRDADAPED